ncbi:8427_t:CDS:10 [Rhizophagus irregularis]|nr:8427_t:CDS:10 [Rhizophagus irregularis]
MSKYTNDIAKNQTACKEQMIDKENSSPNIVQFGTIWGCFISSFIVIEFFEKEHILGNKETNGNKYVKYTSKFKINKYQENEENNQQNKSVYKSPTNIEQTCFDHKYKYIKLLGSGGFGKVFLVQNEQNEKEKLAAKFGAVSLKDEYIYMKELEKLGIAIQAKYGYYDSFSKRHILFMEWIKGGTLYDLVYKNQARLNYKKAKLLLLELKLHMAGLIHRDLKAENIFVVRKTPLKLKLGDFGLCRNISKSPSTNHCGTLNHYAPELFNKKTRTEKQIIAADWWAIGCVLFFCITGGDYMFNPKENFEEQKKHTKEKLLEIQNGKNDYLNSIDHRMREVFFVLFEEDMSKRTYEKLQSFKCLGMYFVSGEINLV